MRFTAVDFLSGIVSRINRNILSLGDTGKSVKRDFDDMSRHITLGLKSIAVSAYALNKIRPGVAAAGDLQEAMIDVRMNLMESGKDAKVLNAELARVKSTAIAASKVAPFSAQEVVEIENTFLKAGLALNDVTAKGGAAWAATALATITKEAPALIANSMVTMAVPFNLKGSQFGELANWLQKVDMASVTNVPELMEGMKYTAGSAAMLRVSVWDTAKALGVIAQSGLRGSMGGTALNDFLTRLNGHSRETRRVMAGLNQYLKSNGSSPLEFWDKQGKLKALPTIINDLRQSMGKLNDKNKTYVLEKIFGEQGMRAAVALMKEGAGSWEEVGKSIGKAASLEDKMTERLKGFNANVKALSGTTRTTLASLFDPMLKPLSMALGMLNEIVAKVGQLADRSPLAATAVSGGAGAAVLGAGAYGVYRLARGGLAGKRVLSGLGGVSGIFKRFGSLGVGVAEGKAMEAAAGITPVFVTNWPADLGGIGNTLPTPGSKFSIPPWLPGAGILAALVAGVPISKYLSDKSRENGFGSGTISHDSRMYEVMGIGARGQAKNDIRLEVNIDGNGRISTITNGLNNSITTLPRGSFFNMAKAH